MIVFRAEAREDSGRMGSAKDCAQPRDLSLPSSFCKFLMAIRKNRNNNKYFFGTYCTNYKGTGSCNGSGTTIRRSYTLSTRAKFELLFLWFGALLFFSPLHCTVGDNRDVCWNFVLQLQHG